LKDAFEWEVWLMSDITVTRQGHGYLLPSSSACAEQPRFGQISQY
jgi:hypothetical protein